MSVPSYGSSTIGPTSPSTASFRIRSNGYGVIEIAYDGMLFDEEKYQDLPVEWIGGASF